MILDYKPHYSGSYAVIIGIDQYLDPRFMPLGEAETDAQTLANVLVSEPYNFKVKLLTGEQASKAAIISALGELQDTQPNDRIIFYFAGHGYTVSNALGQEVGFLACSDTIPDNSYTGLEFDEVTKIRQWAHAKHIAFILDACFSGRALGLTRANAGHSEVKELMTRRAWQVLTAGGDEAVLDAKSMTRILIKALREGVPEQHGVVTFRDIGNFIRDTVSNQSQGMQIPVCQYLEGSSNGEMIFSQPKTKEVPPKAQSLKLYVNYYRADHADFVSTIRTWFMDRYGQEHVFLDFDTVPEFTRFEDFLRQKVCESDALVTIIGPQWINLIREREEKGQPDYVRFELETALKHNKVIVPICIKGAQLPPRDQIPESLKQILNWKITELRDRQDILIKIHDIMDQLEEGITQQGPPRQVENPSTPGKLARITKQVDEYNIHKALDKYYEALHSENLIRALIVLNQMRESGTSIPDTIFNLDRAESELQLRIKGQGRSRRRLEVAGYLYEFVRILARYNQDVTKALHEVWQVEPGYDPDGLATISRTQLSSTLMQTPHGDPIHINLPAPFEWVDIPAGQVTLADDMGTHHVEQFMIGKYPVTNAQFKVFVDEADGFANDEWWSFSSEGRKWRKVNSYPGEPAFDGKSDHPRTNVTWYEAAAYCRWLSSRVGYEVRLPSEKEWQRAAQGSDGRIYPWGNQEPEDRHANWNRQVGETTPVGYYPAGASPYGVLDMAGNVWEWCSTDFETGTDALDQPTKSRVLRGGSWSNSNPLNLRLEHRNYLDPYWPNYYFYGFRLARSY